MMKNWLVITLISAVTAAPTSDDAQASVIQYKNANDGSGNYEFRYETSNGLKRQETGLLVNPGLPDEHIVVEGFYSYVDPEGMEHFVRYTADENGYVASDQLGPRPVIVPEIISSSPPHLVASLLG